MAGRSLDELLPDAEAEAAIVQAVEQQTGEMSLKSIGLRVLRREWWCEHDPAFRAQCAADDVADEVERVDRDSVRAWESYQQRTISLPLRHRRDVERIPHEQWSQVNRDLARIWTGKESVLLVGPEGSGKTTAMVWAAEWCALRGIWVEYTTATLFAAHAKNEGSLDELKDIGLLIIDEIHRFDAIPDWIASALIGVIDYRYYQEKPMLAAGTLPPDKIADVVGKEIVKRFEHRIATDAKSFRT